MAANFELNLEIYGLEHYGKYYSLYDAVVADTADPAKLGRIKVVVPYIDSDNPIDGWFRPSFMQSGNGYGWFWPPEIGDSVIVCFQLGQLNQPLWYFGGWCSTEANPYSYLLGYPEGEETDPSRRGFVTRTGHALVVNEEPDKEEVTLLWTKGDKEASLRLLPDGSIELLNSELARVKLDAENKSIVIEDAANENIITLDSTGVRISTKGKVAVEGASALEVDAKSISLGSGASSSAVLGDALLNWLNSHTHPTGVGPSGPPVPAATPSLLSQTVKVK